ncbi:Nodule Cysteine-Rich (NCR) secreted peptide [Medicago truncatula]|uniref:Nodule Cysteine-Rich (NCR) secreted peptide n=2 Tax=Medicago truncatula TaxID=3880 RepID=I3S866_MEDTR|nr:unknown [Medicago truncatula]KEH37891.1 Nodule Cysteine-Rich (NCR) secreted peptide [Medicago truncatula]
MTNSIKFVYVMMYFLSIFLISTYFETKLNCIDDSDCPYDMCDPGLLPRCLNGWCDCSRFQPWPMDSMSSNLREFTLPN